MLFPAPPHCYIKTPRPRQRGRGGLVQPANCSRDDSLAGFATPPGEIPFRHPARLRGRKTLRKEEIPLAHQFLVVNSFAPAPFGGNPAAVFPDADALDADLMQKIARQLNLVETVFVSAAGPGGADFRLRYFTPDEELPVAGHPTIAAVRALIELGRIDPARQKLITVATKAGNQPVAIDAGGPEPVIAMTQPAPRYHPVVTDRQGVAAVLGIAAEDLAPDLPIQPVDTGLGHLIVPVKSLEALMRLRRDLGPLFALCEKYGMREVQAFAFETYDKACDLHTRNICPREGLEDPGCGSGNGALGAYLIAQKYQDRQTVRLLAEQGTVVNMPCRIAIRASRSAAGPEVSVGGPGLVMIKGVFYC